MRTAFGLKTIVDNLASRSSSLCVSGLNILVGTENGNLIKVDSEQEKCVQTESLSKSKILQLEAIKELDLLVVLSDSVGLYDLKTFKLVTSLTNTRGANLFSVHRYAENVSGDGEKYPAMITKLVVAVRKKLIVYKWIDSTFSTTTEISVNERVQAIDFINGNQMIAALTRNYVLIDGSNIRVLFKVDVLPIIVRIGGEELLVNTKLGSVFVGRDGLPTKNSGIEWSISESDFELHGLAYIFPYIIGISSSVIHVRHIVTSALVQQIEVSTKNIFSTKNEVYLSSEFSIYRIDPISVLKQAEELVDNFLFEEAYILLNSNDSVSFDEKMNNIKRVKMKEICWHFYKGDYEKAFQLIKDIDIDLINVVKVFFPFLLSNDHTRDNSSTAMFFTPVETAYDFMKEYLLGLYDGKKPEIKTSALQVLIRFISEKRPKAIENLEFIDTCLLKCYLHTNNISLAGSLLRLKNHCSVEVAEALLKQYNLSDKLLDLYFNKGLHRRALEYLSKEKKDSLVAYLKQLKSEHLELVFEFSLELGQDQLQIFVDSDDVIYALDYSETWPRDKVLNHLETHCSHGTSILYLEYVIHQKNDTTPEFHNKLIKYYVEVSVQCETPNYEKEMNEVFRTKLLHFLRTSQYYKPEKLINTFLNYPLLKERALLYYKMNQHEKALMIYIEKLNEPVLLYEYLDLCFNTLKEEISREIAIIAVKKLLEFGKVNECLYLIEHKSYRVNLLRVLELLPDSLPLKTCKFFRNYLLSLNNEKMIGLINMNTMKSEYLVKRFEKLNQGPIRIEDITTCMVCKKRIGKGSFCVYAKKFVLHYSCKDYIK